MQLESPSPAGRFNMFSPRGSLSRGAYAAIVVVCALAVVTGRTFGALGTVASWIALAIYVLAIWCLYVAMLRRMRDADLSLWWLVAPLAVSLIVFAIAAYAYQSAPLVANATPLMKFLAVILIVPALLSAVGWLLAKVVVGLAAALAVWAIFVLLLLLPASRASGPN